MDVGANHGSQNGLEELDLAARLPDWARERADGQWYGSPATGRSSHQAKPEARTKLILIVPDEGEDDWAKARLFDNSGQAAALVESLVQEGLAPERMSIFSATQMVVEVVHQPRIELKSRKQEDPSATA
ncbi:MAG: hypothetical protein JSU97_07355 [Dehalococcoidia bacterium]|nr:MAG: hypothetical protein JSU97_07355 [Dehalococcoidia bacterium]